MNPDDHPATVNIQILEQGAQLIRRLGDETFARCLDNPYSGGVGAQFRHCLDFYECFLDGIGEGAIDYNRRERDPGLETDRGYALAKTQSICQALGQLTRDQAGRQLQVCAEQASSETPRWSDSSAGRELQFLISHTVHHYAVVAILLRLQGCDAAAENPDFGVAPSTLAHWKETGSFID
jgi:uncharacterized damage-inducible protein DinB